MHPQTFQYVMLLCSIFLIKPGEPFVGGSDDILGLARSQLDAGPITDAVLRALQSVEQLFDAGAVDFRSFAEGPAIVGDAVDSAIDAVAIGIAQVVLHVADDGIVPVGKVNGA